MHKYLSRTSQGACCPCHFGQCDTWPDPCCPAESVASHPDHKVQGDVLAATTSISMANILQDCILAVIAGLDTASLLLVVPFPICSNVTVVGLWKASRHCSCWGPLDQALPAIAACISWSGIRVEQQPVEAGRLFCALHPVDTFSLTPLCSHLNACSDARQDVLLGQVGVSCRQGCFLSKPFLGSHLVGNSGHLAQQKLDRIRKV